MTTPAMQEERQKLSIGGRVVLYELDLTPINSPDIWYFANTADQDGSNIVFDGNTYKYAAIHLSGVERTATGEQAEPVLSLPNANKFAASLVVQHDDLVGAEIRRMVTLEKFLDGRPAADPSALLEYDIFTVEQKLDLNPIFARFRLRSLGDQTHRKVPNRTCVKNVCQFKYRRWDADLAAFVYAEGSGCDYTASTYFRRDGSSTAVPAEDACGHTVSACALRFGANAELPFGGFPGMSRVRVR